ncbi:MAG: hypothetical protein EOO45_10715, partial [Flavobacterium sp.]
MSLPTMYQKFSFQIVILSVLILCGCKDTQPEPVMPDIKLHVDESCETEYDAMIDDITAAEFESVVASPLVFRAFSTDTMVSSEQKREPFTIATKVKQIEFKDSNPAIDSTLYDEDMVTYFNLGKGKNNKHLVYVRHYETDLYYLIDHETARIDTLAGMPNYSAKGDRFMSYALYTDTEKVIDGKIIPAADLEIYMICNTIQKAVYRHTV